MREICKTYEQAIPRGHCKCSLLPYPEVKYYTDVLVWDVSIVLKVHFRTFCCISKHFLGCYGHPILLLCRNECFYGTVDYSNEWFLLLTQVVKIWELIEKCCLGLPLLVPQGGRRRMHFRRAFVHGIYSPTENLAHIHRIGSGFSH